MECSFKIYECLIALHEYICLINFWDMYIRYFITFVDGDRPPKNNHQRLGSLGLALHYANIITQIDTMVSDHFNLKFFGSLEFLGAKVTARFCFLLYLPS